MKNFFNFIASLFNSESPTSASRFIAFMVVCVLCGGEIYFFIWCKSPEDHITVFEADMWFIGALVGIFKAADVIALRTGVKVSTIEERTPTGTKQSVEKVVMEVQPAEK